MHFHKREEDKLNVMELTRVFLADQQALTIEGIKHILLGLKDFEIIGECGDAEELIPLLAQSNPDILVLDYARINNFSEAHSLELANSFPWLKIIIITNDFNSRQIFKILQRNVMGFITKECGRQEVVNTFRTVRNGQKFFCNKVLDLLMEKNVKNPSEEELRGSLSEREIQIIAFISQGLSTQQMAAELHLSTHTINSHRKNLLKKLQVNTPVELVVKAIKTGIIQINREHAAE